MRANAKDMSEAVEKREMAEKTTTAIDDLKAYQKIASSACRRPEGLGAGLRVTLQQPVGFAEERSRCVVHTRPGRAQIGQEVMNTIGKLMRGGLAVAVIAMAASSITISSAHADRDDWRGHRGDHWREREWRDHEHRREEWRGRRYDNRYYYGERYYTSPRSSMDRRRRRQV